MKRSSVASACALLAGLPVGVGALELRLLRQQRAGGAAFEALEQLDARARSCPTPLVLGLGVEFLGRLSAVVVLRRRWQPAEQRSTRRRSDDASQRAAGARSGRGHRDAALGEPGRRLYGRSLDDVERRRSTPPTADPDDDAVERRELASSDAAATASASTRRWSRCAPRVLAQPPAGADRARPRARRRRGGAHRVAHACAPASGSRSSCGRPPRAAPSAPSRWRWRWCTRTTHLLVIDKPAGLVVHPAAGNWSGTLLNGLLAHHAGAARPAARRHRAPARQGHLGPDGGRPRRCRR